jgi:excisionase family DNA binding protein
MSNRPKLNPSPEKYKGREYLTYDEAADYLGVRNSKLYKIMTELKITSLKFKLDRKRYISNADVKRMLQVKDKPWLAEEKQEV